MGADDHAEWGNEPKLICLICHVDEAFPGQSRFQSWERWERNERKAKG